LLAAGIFVVPAVAQNTRGMMDHGGMMGGMSGNLRGDGIMSRGMSGGCMEMMQGMGNRGARPNEQWRRTTPPPHQGTRS
jgi:hypothetical protein